MTQFSISNPINNFESPNENGKWWAEPDSDRRPLARKANVLTRLDDQPTDTVFVLDSLIFGSMALVLA
jgi:hypothetical protein